MPARSFKRPPTRTRLVESLLQPAELHPLVARSTTEITDAIHRLEDRQRNQFATTADLVIGENRIPHQLARKPSHCLITPTVLSAAFAYALTSADDRLAIIEVAGTAQPGAGIVFF